MADSKKDQKLSSASSVLHALLTSGQSKLSDQFLRWRVWNNWATLVGPRIAGYSIPVGYQHGTFVLWVKTPAHMQELNYGLEPLIQKINQFVGFEWVVRIKLTVDRRHVPKPEETEMGVREYLSTRPPSADEEPPHGR